MRKKIAALILFAAAATPSSRATGGQNFDPSAAMFAGAISMGAPVFVTNTNADLAVPRLSVINPLNISGTISTVVYTSVISTNTGMVTRETASLTNRSINITNILRSILAPRGITNVNGWSLGLISKPPTELETSYPWNLGASPKELLVYRTVSNRITQVFEDLGGDGLSVAFDLPAESYQRGRLSFSPWGDMKSFSSTNTIGVYVSLPSMQLTTNFFTPSFMELKTVVTLTNTIRTNSVRIPSVSWWGTNNMPVNWLGASGGSASGALRGLGYQMVNPYMPPMW